MGAAEGATGAGWIVFGVRTPFAVEVAEIIWRRGEELVALVDNLAPAQPQTWAPEVPVLDPPALALLADRADRSRIVVPQTTPGHRFAVHLAALSCGMHTFDALVDPTAVIGRTTRIGSGAVVNAGALVGGGASIGEFALVNRGVGVGHHARVEPYASLGPGCVLCGGVVVGRGSFVGAGAVLAPGVVLGANATVGAGAVVRRDVPDGVVVVGNPARVVRTDDVGFGGVRVPDRTG